MEFSKCLNTLVIKFRNWSDVLIFKTYLDRWIFRGQNDSNLVLKTTLERAFESRNIDNRHMPTFELMCLSDFQKIAHNISSKLPDDNDMFAWFALMQHYSGPTRLLDFTTSFYIASYFALHNSTKSCAIWAINRTFIIENIRERFTNILIQFGYMRPGELMPDDFLNLVLRHVISGEIEDNFIFTASPKQLDERQYIQQALSVIPSNLNNGFMDTLLSSFNTKCSMPEEDNFIPFEIDKASEYLSDVVILKIILEEECFLEGRRDLNKMSINSFTLFRGLDGLGKHLYDILNSYEHYEKNLKQ